MAVIAVLTYDVDDAEAYTAYVPGSLGSIIPSIQKHGGAPIFSGPADTREGATKTMHVGIRFPDVDAFDAWLVEPDYAEAKAIRLSCTSNYHTFVIDALG